MRPARGLVLVRRVQTEETIPGGRIVLTDDARQKMAANQVQVVRTSGAVDICRIKKCQRPHGETQLLGPDDRDYKLHVGDARIVEGAWCVVRPRALVSVGEESGLYLVREDQIDGVFVIG